ncbi:hypothetical protein GKZ89_18350 [Bacillus mangrovi]|uniref:DUF4304 domain-containing protein n=1 Tax=Metabacillus mangrovi TaxID=1491830 RepID=A0A7X2S841_9BACI|nr:hypothetical protein [Metabacillus mangrovi]MTH55359.1 hypothetical protein [Metabacillus mangrovi]
MESKDLNKELRDTLYPVLGECGFTKITSRGSWKYNDNCIWIMDYEPVGKRFSEGSGWPSMSLFINCAIYFTFIPELNTEDVIKQSSDGQLTPRYNQSHLQETLLCNYNQNEYTNTLEIPADRGRNDIWWIEEDGSNLNHVINSLAEVISVDGMEWLREFSSEQHVLEALEAKRRMSYYDVHHAMHIARRLNLKDKAKKYERLFEKENMKNASLFDR